MVDGQGASIETTSLVYLSDITVTGKRLPEDTNNVTDIFKRLLYANI